MSETLLKGRFNYPSDYRLGAGCVDELASACAALKISRPLVVTDGRITSLDWFPTIIQRLTNAALPVQIYSDIDPNPTNDHVATGVAAFREHNADGCILLGGGSAMDTGKCIALLVDNPGTVFDYEDRGDNWRRADAARIAPSIAIPTTAGTGSEVGRAAVILDPRDHAKKIIFHPELQPDLVLADPTLSVGLPPKLTAATGMDAFAHCFEAYCAPAYHPMADGIALEGMRLIADNLVAAYDDGTNLDARTHLLMAASMGATAFQKGLGLIHALSHPLGGITGCHHGTANAIFQPYVMIHNREVIEQRMPRLAQCLGLPGERFEDVLQWVLDLRERLKLPHTLAGILNASMIPRLVSMAALDPSLSTNPKPCSAEDLERVLTKALNGDLSA